ncbi:TPA: 5'-3' exonuclease H3TH domain-containing protein, partial [Escherichia coli]
MTSKASTDALLFGRNVPVNYLFVDGNSLGYYHQQSDKLHNGEMEV